MGGDEHGAVLDAHEVQLVQRREDEALDEFEVALLCSGSGWAQGHAEPTAALGGRGCEQEEGQNKADGQKLLREFHFFGAGLGGTRRGLLVFDIEVRDAHGDGIFDQNNFTEADQRPTDQDVNILASGARHFEYRSGFEVEYFPHGELLAVQFHFDVDANIAQVTDLVHGGAVVVIEIEVHWVLGASIPADLVGGLVLALEIDRFLTEFIDRGNDLGVGLIATLVDDQIGEF